MALTLFRTESDQLQLALGAGSGGGGSGPEHALRQVRERLAREDDEAPLVQPPRDISSDSD